MTIFQASLAALPLFTTVDVTYTNKAMSKNMFCEIMLVVCLELHHLIGNIYAYILRV